MADPCKLAYPAPVRVVDGLLGEATAERLLGWVLDQERAFRPSKIAMGYDAFVDASRRVSLVLSDLSRIMPLFEPAARRVLDDAIPRLGLIGVESYFLESELGWSGDGAFFKLHADTLAQRASPRLLTMVYYLHTRPKAFSGGQLRVHGLGAGEDSRLYQEFEPQVDRAVLFPSWFPHEVCPVVCENGDFASGRFAINCWLHRSPGGVA